MGLVGILGFSFSRIAAMSVPVIALVDMRHELLKKCHQGKGFSDECVYADIESFGNGRFIHVAGDEYFYGVGVKSRCPSEKFHAIDAGELEVTDENIVWFLLKSLQALFRGFTSL
jgi:hypothetical protein